VTTSTRALAGRPFVGGGGVGSDCVAANGAGASVTGARCRFRRRYEAIQIVPPAAAAAASPRVTACVFDALIARMQGAAVLLSAEDTIRRHMSQIGPLKVRCLGHNYASTHRT
jgi:hypothetical protein